MTEARFQRQAEAECERLGLLWHHCTDPRRCRGPRGFPDLVALGTRGLLMAELKGPDGDTSPQQDLWAWTAHQSGLSIPVVRDKATLGTLLRGIA